MGILCQMILTCILTVKFTKGRKDLPFTHSSATDSSTIYSSAPASLAADSSIHKWKLKFNLKLTKNKQNIEWIQIESIGKIVRLFTNE